MLPTTPIPFCPYDPTKPTHRTQNRLPHWEQAGITYFVTWNLFDAIPLSVRESWELEKQDWLAERGVTTIESPVKTAFVPDSLRNNFRIEFRRKENSCLDQGLGSCLLRSPEARESIIGWLREDVSLYGDFVIMPNHVHLLLVLVDGESSLSEKIRHIKGATARMVNQLLGRSGKLWGKDYFDHAVRNSASLEKIQSYIHKNPAKAGLSPGDYSIHKASFAHYRHGQG